MDLLDCLLLRKRMGKKRQCWRRVLVMQALVSA